MLCGYRIHLLHLLNKIYHSKYAYSTSKVTATKKERKSRFFMNINSINNISIRATFILHNNTAFKTYVDVENTA